MSKLLSWRLWTNRQDKNCRLPWRLVSEAGRDGVTACPRGFQVPTAVNLCARWKGCEVTPDWGPGAQRASSPWASYLAQF